MPELGSEMQCEPCKGNVPSLGDDAIQSYLEDLSEWELEQDGVDKINRDFEFNDFKQAIRFVNHIADMAEEQGHHPNIFIHDWNKVRITLYTHKINGLHENDFIMAAKINDIV